VNFSFTPREEAFRAEVREFLADYQGLDGFFRQGHVWPRVKAMFQAMGERGWLSLAWPEAYGGLAGSAALEYLLWDEVAYARAARNPLAAGIVARTLIRHGTPDQHARWLPPIRSGDLHFSLAYSEPEAGSDLAGLRTRAARRGDVYVVDGRKIWQSYAQDMDCFWLLCRTGAPDSRGRGLSLLIVDKASAGVELTAHPTLDGDQLNEVLFQSVEVPVSQRVGPEDGAWAIMAEALADERHIQFPPGRVRRDVEEMQDWVEAHGLARDPIVAARMGELAVRALEVEMHGLRVLDAMLKGRPAVVEAAANKVVHTVVCQEIARAVMDFGGPETLVDDSRPALLWCQSMWETIGGGTSEVMRGVVARQGLGLGGRA
jgi:alkylation response protein AidB-like acyl-CoA dehydrogenase